MAEAVEDTLYRASSGGRLSREDALSLLAMPPGDTLSAGILADRVREERAGNFGTYVLNRNINFTNICTGSCKFCAFRRRPGSSEAYIQPVEEMVSRAREAEELGATEVCIQGGLHPELMPEDYGKIIRKIRRSTELHLHAFSPMEVHYMAERSGWGIAETLSYLKENGLDSIPGTAAEILVDEVREEICPSKLSTKEWVRVIRTAHLLGIPTTATMLFGHVEEKEHIAEHLSILRQIQDETGGFTEFVPLPFVHPNTELFREGRSRAGATGLECARVYIASRLYLDNFTNLQASWVKLGRKFSQLMLRFGANDLGGTLMEESISRCAGADYEMLSREEMVRIIRGADLMPRQRDTLYNPLVR